MPPSAKFSLIFYFMKFGPKSFGLTASCFRGAAPPNTLCDVFWLRPNEGTLDLGFKKLLSSNAKDSTTSSSSYFLIPYIPDIFSSGMSI